MNHKPTILAVEDDAAIRSLISTTLRTHEYTLSLIHILHSTQSAVLSAIIYNALIIVALIPLALKGVKYREVSSGKLLSRNLLIYGLGGLVAPFVFIKLIDMLLVVLGLA